MAKHRAIRITIRGLLILTLVAAVWFSHLARQDAVLREIVGNIERAGGSVTESREFSLTLFPSQRITSISIPQGELIDISNNDLSKFPSLNQVVVENFKITYPTGAWLTLPANADLPISATKLAFLDDLRDKPETIDIPAIEDARVAPSRSKAKN